MLGVFDLGISSHIPDYSRGIVVARRINFHILIAQNLTVKFLENEDSHSNFYQSPA